MTDWHKNLILDISSIAIFSVLAFSCVIALAGGTSVSNEPIDPFNGCFAESNAQSNGIEEEADYLNHRAKYIPINDDARKLISELCWRGDAKCLNIPVICYNNGNVIYNGSIKLWRPIKKR